MNKLEETIKKWYQKRPKGKMPKPGDSDFEEYVQDIKRLSIAAR